MDIIDEKIFVSVGSEGQYGVHVLGFRETEGESANSRLLLLLSHFAHLAHLAYPAYPPCFFTVCAAFVSLLTLLIFMCPSPACAGPMKGARARGWPGMEGQCRGQMGVRRDYN